MSAIPISVETVRRDPVEKSRERSSPARTSFDSEVVFHFDGIASEYPKWRRKMSYYIRHSTEFLQAAIPPNKSVLLVGCLAPEILESLQPARGVGIDPSSHLIRLAKQRNSNPKVNFFFGQPEDYRPSEKFDYVVLLNAADYSQDLFILMESLKHYVHAESKVLISMLNPIWDGLARWASALGLRIPDTKRNRIAARVIETALNIKGFQVDGIHRRVLLPRRIPGISRFINQFLARLPGLNRLCFLQYIAARPTSQAIRVRPSCSVIIPCYNEEGNIRECVRRVPAMGAHTEIVIVNDGSRDQTLEIAQVLQKQYRNVRVVSHFPNRGKGYAVMKGIRAARGDIVMILDADMTVMPEELTEFYEALESGTADFVNGTRFLYPMERDAMRISNFFGNIVFSRLTAIITGAEYSDTLCGTKAMWRRDFVDIQIEDSKWGDFDLIFHAAKRRLKTVQVPVHYKSRTAGESKMRAFRAGLAFLRLCFRKWADIP